jgi:hypothetical protein
MKRIITAIAILGIVSLAQAHDTGDNWEAKKQEQFSKIKEVKLQGFREKISILQDAQSCTEAAKTHEDMKPCEERERAAMEDHARRMKDRWESIKPK